MKKHTNAEKNYALNEACALINEARIMMKKAMRLLNDVCGIDICDHLCSQDVKSYEKYANNIQIYSGISKLESISGESGAHPIDEFTGERDLKHKYIEYKGLRFVQVGQPKADNYIYR